MRPARLDLPTVWRGTDWGTVTIIWKDKDGNPFDLTGYEAKAFMRQASLNAVVSDAPNGATQISLDSAQTVLLRLGVDYWDFIFTNTGNGLIIGPLLTGTVTIKQPITSPNGSAP